MGQSNSKSAAVQKVSLFSIGSFPGLVRCLLIVELAAVVLVPTGP